MSNAHQMTDRQRAAMTANFAKGRAAAAARKGKPKPPPSKPRVFALDPDAPPPQAAGAPAAAAPPPERTILIRQMLAALGMLLCSFAPAPVRPKEDEWLALSAPAGRLITRHVPAANKVNADVKDVFDLVVIVGAILQRLVNEQRPGAKTPAAPRSARPAAPPVPPSPTAQPPADLAAGAPDPAVGLNKNGVYVGGVTVNSADLEYIAAQLAGADSE